MSTEDQLSQIKGVRSLTEFYDKHKKNFNIGSIVLIVLLAGIWYYFKIYSPNMEKEAQGQLFMAERYFGLDSTDKALNGDGLYPGVLEVADKYGSTNAGNLANYYAARIYLTDNKYQEALDYFDNVSFDDEFMAAAVTMLKGDCYSELGDYEKAASLYSKAADKRDNDITAPTALLKAATAYEASEDYDKGIKALTRLKKEYYDTEEAKEADKFIGRLQGKKAAKK